MRFLTVVLILVGALAVSSSAAGPVGLLDAAKKAGAIPRGIMAYLDTNAGISVAAVAVASEGDARIPDIDVEFKARAVRDAVEDMGFEKLAYIDVQFLLPEYGRTPVLQSGSFKWSIDRDGDRHIRSIKDDHVLGSSIGRKFYARCVWFRPHDWDPGADRGKRASALKTWKASTWYWAKGNFPTKVE